MGKAVSVILAAAWLGACWAPSARAQEGLGPMIEPGPTTRQARQKKAAEDLTVYFLEQYGKALAGPDWVNRAMAVISLSGIDDPRVTEKLLEVLGKDPSKFVRAYAWEALHARSPRLTPEQRGKWIDEGLFLATKADVMNGRLRLGLVRAMASRPCTEPARVVFRKIFNETNLLHPPDNEVLEAMTEAVAAWKDRVLIRQLVNAMGHGDACYRAEYVLRGLKCPLRAFEKVQEEAVSDLKPLWGQYQREYAAWLNGAGFAGMGPEGFAEYAGRSDMVPEPEAIVDPSAPKWRRQLEVPSLHLDALAVCIVLDTTGSMGPAIEWVKSDVGRLMRALRLIAREPTMGLVLYRDRGDAYVTQPVPMTGDPAVLGRALKAVKAQGGGDYPEALFEGLWEAFYRQAWPRTSSAGKVVIVVTDAPPHKRDVPELQKLLDNAVKHGFHVHCLKVPTNDYFKALTAAQAAGTEAPLEPSRALDCVAQWGGGFSYSVRFSRAAGPAQMRPGVTPWVGSGDAGGDDTPERQIIGSILRSILTKEFHDRVDPYVKVLLETLAESPPEKREYLPYVKPREARQDGTPPAGGGGGARPVGNPKPPTYKQ